MVKVAYLGRELEVPRYLFPHAIEAFERRRDVEREKRQKRELAEKKAYLERQEEIKEARRRSLREEFPLMFPRR